MAQYATTISQSTFVFDETKQLYKTQIDTTTLSGFENATFNVSMLKVMRYDSDTRIFKDVVIHSEIDSNGILTIYADEKFNLKILIVTDH